ncbi:MAG TPA: YidC/Oxa1 family insertase periplasmic-domain containing protein [Gemmataceae bacterium]|nr:YidC/Oxa1 family insertase periplasmic-domain containing protein [Gemmataceae bacterium]
MNKTPTRNLVLFAIVCMLIIFGYSYFENKFWPKPPPQKPTMPPAEVVATVHEWVGWDILDPIFHPPPAVPRAEVVSTVREWVGWNQFILPLFRPPVAVAKPELIEMGDESSYLQVRFTTYGGGVDRLILTNFPEADVYGKEIKLPNGKPKPLHLIPSPNDLPPEQQAQMTHDSKLPSFLLYYYAKPNDDRPVNTLGERLWKLDSPKPNPADENQEVRFSTELPEMGVKITKIFTLNRKKYHLGLTVKIEALPRATPQPFRYQIAGGHRLPVEGMWYTNVYHNAIFGWQTSAGNGRRDLFDAASIQFQSGSEREIAGSDKILQYAAIVTQYFASAICVDEQQDKRDFVEFSRATAEGTENKSRPFNSLQDVAEMNAEGYYPPEKHFLADICPRMISQPLNLAESGPVEHKYLLYHGPVKVRLLNQLRGDQAVDSDLVERYAATLNLKTMTDYHANNAFGRFANTIGWTYVTIQTTNLMHWILGGLSRFLPLWLAIFVLTVLVRGALSPLSRRQAAKAAEFQEKMKQYQPELKRLEEQYRGREQEFQQVKMKFLMDHGLNPMSQMGGCLLMIAQWPIFIGLYYCLQENVFFRLDPFLWMPNLSAPDMLFWWSEKIPYLSEVSKLGNTLYLGPYFNLLPCIAVALMIVQQKYMTPPATDEQQAMQQKTMKWMMLIIGVMFYKVAAGLCLYFIAGSLWSLVERKVFPKPTAKKKQEPDSPGKAVKRKGKGPKPSPNGSNRLRDLWDKIRREAEKKRRV